MNTLTADFDIEYPGGPPIQAELQRRADCFSVAALFGPSGCGKTTILRALAGLARPQRGHIRYGQAIWLDTARGNFCPPAQRNIGFLFQDYALFPHLTVRRNIEYGLRRHDRPSRRQRSAELIKRLALNGLEGRYPHQISSGQQQRVALARTLARQPNLLLLDEPLSAVDATLRDQLQTELRELLIRFEIPSILVTHDRREVLALADDLMVMDGGRLCQTGPVEDVLARPRNARVAGMLGVENILSGRVTQRRPQSWMVEVAGRQLLATGPSPRPTAVQVCIRAHKIELLAESTGAQPVPNQLQATLVDRAPGEGLITLTLDCGFPLIARVPEVSFKSVPLQIGGDVVIHIPPGEIHWVEAEDVA